MGGGKASLLVTSSGNGRVAFSPVACPDGDYKVAYVSDVNGGRAVFLANVDGTEVTELTASIPNGSVGFWNDPDNEKYRDAYFAGWPDVWAHGDYGEVTEQGGFIIHGRSDAVLNPGGVRIGTAEIYRQVEKLDEIVEKSLRRGAIWDEVKDRLDAPGTGLSGGQQQRLCIARAVATEPEVLLMDEPCSALDPIATAQVEELIDELRTSYSVVIVTHSMQQAARVSQKTAFFHLGNLVEFDDTSKIFTNPTDERTESYITGRIG